MLEWGCRSPSSFSSRRPSPPTRPAPPQSQHGLCPSQAAPAEHGGDLNGHLRIADDSCWLLSDERRRVGEPAPFGAARISVIPILTPTSGQRHALNYPFPRRVHEHSARPADRSDRRVLSQRPPLDAHELATTCLVGTNVNPPNTIARNSLQIDSRTPASRVFLKQTGFRRRLARSLQCPMASGYRWPSATRSGDKPNQKIRSETA